jgi:AraC family transcriptional regulator
MIRQVGASVLNELSEQTATSQMVAEMSSLMLATRLIQNYVDRNLIDRITGAARSLDHARTRRVLDYIDQNLEEDFTIHDLAQVAHLSVFHFARMFANRMGMPPQRYVSQRRLESAKKMIGTGRLPLSEIAFRSGFSSQASFTRAFRRATNMTPGEFRQQGR